MRLTYTFLASLTEKDSGEELSADEAINDSVLTLERLDKYLDPDLADAGVVGGEIRAIATNGQAALKIIYWIPVVAVDLLVHRLKEYTIAQLTDGVGESGFEFEFDGKHLVIAANTDENCFVEITEDGNIVPRPSQIAIAARDGDLTKLVTAIESDPRSIEKLHQGYSALQLAILYGHTEAIRVLLSAGADPNLLDSEGSTPLELCAMSNSLDDEQSCFVAQLMLNAGADQYHISPNGQSARSYADLRGKTKLADILRSWLGSNRS